MDTTADKSRLFVRFVAAPIAAVGILGGAALGLAAGANADPGPSDYSHSGYSGEFRPSHDSRDFHDTGFWGFWPSNHHWGHDSFRS